jgi:16S rRNA (guanine(966)-N(2))-methyltransferase RsmD
MRIIAGHLKGRRLVAPKGLDVRPTSDRLRETLFNVLANDVDGARVLDGFAGTGALGLEAWSRGASAIVFVEQNERAIRALTDNVAHCGAADACVIIRGDFKTVHIAPPFDLVLLDPPYRIDDLDAVTERASTLLKDGGRLVLEHGRRHPSPERAGRLMRYRVLVAGDSVLSFYALPAAQG